MYQHTNQKTVTKLSSANTESMYNEGYVFTRLGKGVMQQIKSVRVDLEKFKPSSENRRILNKNEKLRFHRENLPTHHYSWKVAKMAKDFYDAKAGLGTMSANKIKEMFEDMEKSNMNAVFEYFLSYDRVGLCLIHETNNILHYAFPFYDLTIDQSNLGMGMMLRAIIWSQAHEKKYIYLGSHQKYKLQFKGVEYFEESKWNKI